MTFMIVSSTLLEHKLCIVVINCIKIYVDVCTHVDLNNYMYLTQN